MARPVRAREPARSRLNTIATLTAQGAAHTVDTRAAFATAATDGQAGMLDYLAAVGRTALGTLGGVNVIRWASDWAIDLGAEQLTVETLAGIAADRVGDVVATTRINDT